MKFIPDVRRFAVPMIGPIVLLLLWHLLAQNEATAIFVPTPAASFARVISLLRDGAILLDFGATVGRWLTGFALAVLIGAPIGLLLGAYPPLARATSLVVDFFRSLPVTAIFPLFLVMFGVGANAMIAMVFFATVFIVIIHASYGVRSTPRARQLMAQSFGATPLQVFWRIRAVEAAGHVLIGARTALSLSLIVSIVAEMFIGANKGLGQRLYLAYQLNTLTDLYALILMIGVMGYVANVLFMRAEKLAEF